MTGNRHTDLTKVFKELVSTLISVVEYKDVFFKGHSERVAANCVLFSRHLSLPHDFIDAIYLAGLLYDIGMVYVPTEIIHKPGKLTEEEMNIVKEHPLIAEKILSHLSYFKDIIPIIRHHHEAYDGSGYPQGLSGENIPLGSRILCILDGYDAMTSDRPHRSALSKDKAIEQIRINAGKTFDPKLVDDFISFISKKEEPTNDKNSVHKKVLDVVELFKKGRIELPVFPAVIQKIQDVINSPVSSPDHLAKVIEQDQVVTLRLISVANSVHYGGGGNIQTVRQAVSRIGMRETQNIVSTIATKTLYATDNELVKTLMEKFWVHAIATAYIARSLAKLLRSLDLDILFLLGLTHDIGKVLLLHALTKILFKKGTSTEVNMDDIIASIQDIHASFGGALLQRWGFKEDMVTVVSCHEKPEISVDTPKNIIIIYLANILSRKIGYSLFTEEADISEALKILGIGNQEIEKILTESTKLVQAATG